MGNGELTALGMELALDETFVETPDVKVDLVAGKTAQTGHEYCHEKVHVAGMGHDAAHD
jgi:hypothetical protein